MTCFVIQGDFRTPDLPTSTSLVQVTGFYPSYRGDALNGFFAEDWHVPATVLSILRIILFNPS